MDRFFLSFFGETFSGLVVQYCVARGNSADASGSSTALLAMKIFFENDGRGWGFFSKNISSTWILGNTNYLYVFPSYQNLGGFAAGIYRLVESFRTKYEW